MWLLILSKLDNAGHWMSHWYQTKLLSRLLLYYLYTVIFFLYLHFVSYCNPVSRHSIKYHSIIITMCIDWLNLTLETRQSCFILRGNENIEYLISPDGSLTHNHRVYGHMLCHCSTTRSKGRWLLILSKLDIAGHPIGDMGNHWPGYYSWAADFHYFVSREVHCVTVSIGKFSFIYVYTFLQRFLIYLLGC